MGAHAEQHRRTMQNWCKRLARRAELASMSLVRFAMRFLGNVFEVFQGFQGVVWVHVISVQCHQD